MSITADCSEILRVCSGRCGCHRPPNTWTVSRVHKVRVTIGLHQLEFAAGAVAVGLYSMHTLFIFTAVLQSLLLVNVELTAVRCELLLTFSAALWQQGLLVETAAARRAQYL